MASFITLTGKKPKLTSLATAVYREEIAVVDDAPQNAQELTGPISSGTAITLPLAQVYQGDELQVKLNGLDMVPLRDYNCVGAGPDRTQISMTFTLEGTRAEPDVLEFYIENA